MTFLARAVRALNRSGVDFAIAGGYAVNLHGVVRGTVDIDIVLRLERENYRRAEKALTGLGLVSRQPINAKDVYDFREEYIANKNMVAWNFTNPSDPTEAVNVIITDDLKKMKIKNIDVEGLTTPVLALKDLIKMKKRSARPQDLEDVRALEERKR